MDDFPSCPVKQAKLMGALAVAGVSALSLGAFLTFVSSKAVHMHTCGVQAEFVNPDMVCGAAQVLDKKAYTTLRNDLRSFLDVQKSAGTIQEAGIYFRDLENGPVMGIGESADFIPASLLKLPLALAILDLEEDDNPEETPLDDVIQVDSQASFSQTFKPTEQADGDRPYSIRSLLYHMLAHSDNASYEALQGYMEQETGRNAKRIQSFQNLGIVDPRSPLEPTLSVRGYSSLFRLLYNASFLSVEHSNLVLEWLSASTFTEGLRAGVPTSVPVAHKFGERTIMERKNKTTTRQLHDCGIIYYPGNPYLLCVMTTGTDFDALLHVIRTISSLTYKEVDSRRL